MKACRSDRHPRFLPGLILVMGLWGLGVGFAAQAALAQETPAPGIELLPDSVRVPEPVEIENGTETFRITVDDPEETDHSIQISIDRDYGGTGRVKFGEDIVIHEGEYIDGDVVVIGGTITNDGKIAGDCVAVGGNILIGDRAVVNGDVVCLSGNLEIGEYAQIRGDAVSVWGKMTKAPTAVVRGDVEEVGGFSPVIGIGPLWDGVGVGGFRHELWSFLRRLVWVVVLFGLSLLVFQLFPTRMQRLADTAATRGWAAFFAGLAGWVLWLPVFIALLITIVGIPVAFMLILLTPLMVLLGYAAVAAVAGERLGGRFSSLGTTRTRAVLFGILALEGGVLLGRLLGILGSVFDLFAGLLALFGYMVIFIGATVGFGALLMTRFRAPEEPPAEAPVPTFPAPTRPGTGPSSAATPPY